MADQIHFIDEEEDPEGQRSVLSQKRPPPTPGEIPHERKSVRYLQVPEPSYKVRFQQAVEFPEEDYLHRKRAGRRRSISMPSGLDLLLQFAEFSCQPKPTDEKDYFDEVEEQQIHRSNSNTAADPRLRQPPEPPETTRQRFFDSSARSESNDGDIEDTEELENMSTTTGDDLSELDSPSADPPPPYPGGRKAINGRKRPRFQEANAKAQIEDDDTIEDEFSKKPLAMRRKSGGVLPIKIINSNYNAVSDHEPPSSPTRVNEPAGLAGSVTNFVRGKFNYVSNTIPKKFGLRRRTADEHKIQIFVSILFLAIILLIGSIYVIHQEKELQKAYFFRIKFASKDRKFRLSNLNGREVLTGVLGTSLASKDKAWPCLKIHKKEGQSCLEWMDKARLYFRLIDPIVAKDPTSTLNPSLENQESVGDSQQCYETHWEGLSPTFIPQDCFYISERRGFHFYGGGEQEINQWPLNRTTVPLSPFITGNKLDVVNRSGQTTINPNHFQWGRFLNRQFFGAPGVSIQISKDVPLHISINSAENPGMICFAAKHDNFANPTISSSENLLLNYTICTGKNIAEVALVQQFATSRDNLEDLRHEDVLFARRLIKTPIWHVLPSIFSPSSATSNNSNSSTGINEKQLLGHADRIKAETLTGDVNSILLMDESWEKYLGDFEIDSDRFPTIIQTLNYTQRRGFDIAMTVKPYFSTASKNYVDGLQKELWIKEKTGRYRDRSDVVGMKIKSVPALIPYKSSDSVVMLDVTRSKARGWFEEKIRSFVRKYSISSLFVEVGSSAELPEFYQFHQSLKNPDEYSQLLVQSVRKGVGQINTIGVSSAIKSPKLPTFVSLSPIESSWAGLQSIIPNLLTLGITGFSFVMTGPIGGSYKRTSQLGTETNPLSVYEANKPDRNLYIRWLELSYFLPLVQYSYLPSDYDPEVLLIAKTLKSIREAKVQSVIKKALQEALTQGIAIIQPLWMIDPNDINCLIVSDQFSIGGQIIVAPVLKFNTTEREIYLPKGRWRDELYGTTTKGEKWLHRYPVKEDQIAYFTKMADAFST